MRAPDEPLRIVVQNGEYWLCNKGDLAMLTVTVDRLRRRWPTARIGVLTSAPHLLSAYFPDAEPILDRGAGGWTATGTLRRWAAKAGPRWVGPASLGWLAARERPERFARRVQLRLHAKLPLIPAPSSPRLPIAVDDADLVLAMGGGYLADADPVQTARTLELVGHAVAAGVPTALVGQGIGPLEDTALLARAAEVLPRVDFIALREGRRGPTLLDGLGVPRDRVSVTGDDAIALAYDVRTEDLGSRIGVCLRVADYSPVGSRKRDAVGRAVRQLGHEMGAELAPLIISDYQSEDRRSTLPLVMGYARTVPPLGRYVWPGQLAERVSSCRILVTGAYHLAVFALSQGIPVVGLSSSTYYDDKLLGLAEMFGGGLRLVRLDAPDIESELTVAARAAWHEAPDVRARLRARADEQITLSENGFEKIFDLVEERQRRLSVEPA